MKIIIVIEILADGVVAELVDAPDSKSGFFGSESSILSGPTIENKNKQSMIACFFYLFKFFYLYFSQINHYLCNDK